MIVRLCFGARSRRFFGTRARGQRNPVSRSAGRGHCSSITISPWKQRFVTVAFLIGLMRFATRSRANASFISSFVEGMSIIVEPRHGRRAYSLFSEKKRQT